MVKHHLQSLPHLLAKEVPGAVPSRSTWYCKIGGVFYVNVGVKNTHRGRLCTELSDQRKKEAETGSGRVGRDRAFTTPLEQNKMPIPTAFSDYLPLFMQF